MPVRDHPLYAQWREASDRLAEASKRFGDAEKKGVVGEENIAKHDLDEAQANYDKISILIG
jgi:hypothetical protein